jgi:uncharacterized protein YidB (DUF937 family)
MLLILLGFILLICTLAAGGNWNKAETWVGGQEYQLKVIWSNDIKTAINKKH